MTMALRKGFSLVEVVVAGVILALLAAVTIPSVMDALDKKRISDTYDLLQEVQYAFSNTTNTGFLNVVRSGASVSVNGTIPSRLSQLSEPLISSTTAMVNSCGSSYTSTAASTWASYGPFLKRPVSTVDGLRTPIGNIQNTLTRSLAIQATYTQPVYIQMQISNVDSADAVALDKLMDGAQGSTTGAIRYSISNGVTTVSFFNGETHLLFLVPIANRC